MSKSETAVFLDNFYSALRMLGGNPGGSVLELRQGAGAFSTGLPFAGENYAIFDTSPAPEELCGYWISTRRGSAVSAAAADTAGGAGIGAGKKEDLRRATYLAMSIRNFSANGQRSAGKESLHRQRGREWAEAAWTGFEGELPVPRAYAVFSRYLFRCPANSLFFLEREGHPLCSALLHSTEKSSGLYYFATIPSARRQGLAARFMDSLREYASRYSGEMVLLATEMGAKCIKAMASGN